MTAMVSGAQEAADDRRIGGVELGAPCRKSRLPFWDRNSQDDVALRVLLLNLQLVLVESFEQFGIPGLEIGLRVGVAI